jgi:Domain of unknown function (DUF4397)
MRGKLFRILPLAAVLIGVGSILLAAGCGSGNSRFRYIQGSTGSQGTAVDLYIDNNKKLSAISYGTAGTYQSISSGTHLFDVYLSGTTTNPFFNASFGVNKGDNTIISNGNLSQMAMNVFSDDNVVPASGNVKLKFIHVAPTAGSVDIYVISPNTGIGGLSPQLSNLTFQHNNEISSITAGNYEVIMTQSGTQNPIPGLDITYTWTAGQVRTIVILDSVTGGGPYSQLLLSDVN